MWTNNPFLLNFLLFPLHLIFAQTSSPGLYGLHYLSHNISLQQIDPITGAMTQIGTTLQQNVVPGLACLDNIHGMFWFGAYSTSDSPTFLVGLNITSGQLVNTSYQLPNTFPSNTSCGLTYNPTKNHILIVNVDNINELSIISFDLTTMQVVNTIFIGCCFATTGISPTFDDDNQLIYFTIQSFTTVYHVVYTYSIWQIKLKTGDWSSLFIDNNAAAYSSYATINYNPLDDRLYGYYYDPNLKVWTVIGVDYTKQILTELCFLKDSGLYLNTVSGLDTKNRIVYSIVAAKNPTTSVPCDFYGINVDTCETVGYKAGICNWAVSASESCYALQYWN